MVFVQSENAVRWLDEHVGIRASQDALDALEVCDVLPKVLNTNGEMVFLQDDLIALAETAACLSQPNAIKYALPNLFERGQPVSLAISPTTTVEIAAFRQGSSLALAAAIRNLAVYAHSQDPREAPESNRVQFIGESIVTTSDAGLAAFAQEQAALVARCTGVKSSLFASSASYMGSKRALSGFLVAAISTHVSSEGLILDLMSGSGAAAAAFARVWETFASDAQTFSHILGIVQGGGYSIARADNLIATLLPRAREHSLQLRKRLEDFVSWEDRVFHGDTAGSALADYKALIDAFPTYPDGSPRFNWDPVAEVNSRKLSPQLQPFCLFTAYFANVYFGIRQCIEIDSLRFAISSLENEEDRTWALGALIASVSYLGTTYGGHFAQPVIRDAADLTAFNIRRLIELRASSVLHEFSIRLESLAKESAACPRRIRAIEGPWQSAIDSIADKKAGREVLVYLDAPYKREEYSRYYHVLETLILYNYPSSFRVGRVPNKSLGERFRSEFFSRSQEKIENTFVSLICRILEMGWKCAWSYSDNGDANIARVCERVMAERSCRVSSYATPYEHNAIGGPNSKEVMEYLYVFEPT